MVEKGLPVLTIMEKAGADKGNLDQHGDPQTLRHQALAVRQHDRQSSPGCQNSDTPGARLRQERRKRSDSLESIMVPLDSSGLAEPVLPHVVDLARAMNVEVVLVRAFERPPRPTTERIIFRHQPQLLSRPMKNRWRNSAGKRASISTRR
jgi:hypothetical protein